MLALQLQDAGFATHARGEGCCDGGSAPDDCCNPATSSGYREMLHRRQAVRARTANFMGLNAAGDADVTVATVTESVAERVARIRAKMISLGIPIAVGTGAVTMLTFAGAFGLAHTERVWAPAIWLGALTTIGGLISVALAAKVTADEGAAAAAPTPSTSTAPAPAATATSVATAPAVTAPAAFGYYY